MIALKIILYTILTPFLVMFFAYLFGRFQMHGWLDAFINFKKKEKQNEKETE